MALMLTTIALPLASCAHNRNQTTLYERLGGQPTIDAGGRYYFFGARNELLGRLAPCMQRLCVFSNLPAITSCCFHLVEHFIGGFVGVGKRMFSCYKTAAANAQGDAFFIGMGGV